MKTMTSRSSSSLIPVGVLPSYLALAFGDIYEDDGLCVFGKGLGWLNLLASLVRFYADTTDDGHVALVEEHEKESRGRITSNSGQKEKKSGRDSDVGGEDDGTNSKKEQRPSRRCHSHRKPPLIIVMGLHGKEHELLLQLLESWGTPQKFLPTIITNESGHSKDRAALYRRGGVFCVTSRILIVDFLTGTINSNDVDGMLIGHAEQVTGDSTEAFIVRIYTTQRRRDRCFIKAFSDSPERLVTGFANIDKILKALQIRNMYLYPRFHEAVQDELNGRSTSSSSPSSGPENQQRVRPPIIVDELKVGLSPKMKDIQSAIVTAVKGCMNELKKSTPMVEWNQGNDDLRIENCVTSNFDRAVSKQLEKDWHRLKPDSKQLVQDLRTLRTLFQYLIQYDCVSFWKLISTIKAMSSAGGGPSRNQAMWLLTPAAQLLFQRAKERLYVIESRDDQDKTNINVDDDGIHVENPVHKQLKPVLEENPKWKLLREVLTEAIKDSSDMQQKKRGEKVAASIRSTILIVVKDERTVDAIRTYLVEGRDRTLALRWLKYLENYNDRSRSVAGSKISEESRLLLEEEGRVRRILFGKWKKQSRASKKASSANNMSKKRGRYSENLVTGKKLNQVPSYVKKRRRIEVERGRGGEITFSNEDRDRHAALDEALEEAEHDLHDLDDDGRIDEAKDATSYNSDDDFGIMFRSSFLDEPRIIAKSLTSMEDAAAGIVLADLDPDYVILYDFDIAFVRSVEVHAALRAANDGRQLKAYFLVFEASSEQKVFLKSLEREKNAFEKLIHHKKHMPPPVLLVEGTQELQQAMVIGSVGSTYANGRLPLAFDSRRAGSKNKNEKRNIAVDVREFRSALPSILHRGGMRLAPVTLTVGDFVLSNVHCVERKSIGDLFGSLGSGRLYTQAEAMSKYYTCPILLIEFDPSKSFSLQSEKDLGMDIRIDSICSKIAILTIHFPKLRILWSKSPHETLRIFKELKQKHEEVDVARAIEIGHNDTDEALLQPDSGAKDDLDSENQDEINEAGRDMLLRLPGMTVPVARQIMAECDDLASVIALSRDDLRRLAGPVTGQRLFTFFQQKFGSL